MSFAKRAWGRIKAVLHLFVVAGKSWSDDNATTLAASLAYTTIFSIAPLLVVAVSIAGFFFDEAQARAAVMHQLGGLVGADGMTTIEGAMEATGRRGGSVWGIIGGVAVLILGAAGVFAQLQGSLNLIWRVKPKPGNAIWAFVRKRLLSFGMVAAIAFLLMVSLLLSTALAALTNWLAAMMPGAEVLLNLGNVVLSLALITGLFALTFRVLPDVKLAWGDVWLGAAVTALLFTGGKFLIGLYLGQASIASSYGAAGSIVVFLVWVYYSGMIFFYGAEFTRAFASRHGSSKGGLPPAEEHAQEERTPPQITR